MCVNFCKIDICSFDFTKIASKMKIQTVFWRSRFNLPLFGQIWAKMMLAVPWFEKVRLMKCNHFFWSFSGKFGQKLFAHPQNLPAPRLMPLTVICFAYETPNGGRPENCEIAFLCLRTVTAFVAKRTLQQLTILRLIGGELRQFTNALNSRSVKIAWTWLINL